MSFRVVEECFDLHQTDEETGRYLRVDIKELGVYETYKQARKAAIEARDRNSYFDDWEEVVGEENVDELPFCSWENENPDEDDAYVISIEDIDREKRRAAQEIEQIMVQEKSKKKREKRKATKTKTPVWGNCAISKDKVDDNIFLRNPSRLPKTNRLPPSSFPGSGKSGFVDLIRRLSNTAYACIGTASKEHGVQYTVRSGTKKKEPVVVWISDNKLDEHGSDETVLDTVHTDLINHRTGVPLVTAADIKEHCTPEIKHLILNKVHSTGNVENDAPILVQAMDACSSLETIYVTEWAYIPASIFQTLAKHGSTLRGIHFQNVSIKEDAIPSLIRMLKACPNLKWFGMTIQSGPQIPNNIFKSLPESLQVLFLQNPGRGNLGLYEFAEMDTRLANLKIRLVFPQGKKFETSM